jgi:hypothetical protein
VGDSAQFSRRIHTPPHRFSAAKGGASSRAQAASSKRLHRLKFQVPNGRFRVRIALQPLRP